MPHIASLSGFHFASPSLLQRLGETLRTWQVRAQERNDLARFSPYELRDIGMTEAERVMELAKPVWRA